MEYLRIALANMVLLIQILKYEFDFRTLSTFNKPVNMYEFLAHTFFYLSTAAANCMMTLTNSVALSVNNDLSATLVCNSQCV